jgi:hypothetical protein
LIQFVTGMTNIRDVIPFPRFPGNAEFWPSPARSDGEGWPSFDRLTLVEHV